MLTSPRSDVSVSSLSSVSPDRSPVRLFALVPCGGTGSRAGAGSPKQYRVVADEPVLVHTLRALLAVPDLYQVMVVVAAADTEIDAVLTRTPHLDQARIEVARCAGSSRAQTVYHGLNALLQQGADPHDWVLVHDAARCLIRPQEIQTLMSACMSDAVGGLLALKLPDTLKAEVQGRVSATVAREDKWLAQTPQMFRIRDLYYALALAEADGFVSITDEASAIEGLGLQPLLVAGRADNIKLTYPDDFALADAVLKSRLALDIKDIDAIEKQDEGESTDADANVSSNPIDGADETLTSQETTVREVLPSAAVYQSPWPWRIGEGWDCHALVPGRDLILGGVRVPHTHGLLGHSDADVLLHAITDALLGAAGLGDIGRHFPDTDVRFKGADSRMLLAEAMTRVRAAGWALVNLDSTIVAQAPKLSPYIPQMQACIAETLGVAVTLINVKAKTAEKLGPVGQGLSLEAQAVAMLGRA